METFRQKTNHRLQYWRRWQLVGLSLAQGGFLLIIAFTAMSAIPVLAGISACGVAIMLGIYCSVKRQLKCPKCGASLGYLVVDPSYAGTPGAIILPRQLPEKVTHCPYCKSSFDEVTDACAPRASL